MTTTHAAERFTALPDQQRLAETVTAQHSLVLV